MKDKAINKFQLIEDQLRDHCKKCEFYMPGKCLKGKRVCIKIEKMYAQLSYDILYPAHPCRTCLVRPICSWNSRCENFRDFITMQAIARCEMKGQHVFFSRNGKLLLEDSPKEIGNHGIAQAEDLDGRGVGVEFSERYIKPQLGSYLDIDGITQDFQVQQNL